MGEAVNFTVSFNINFKGVHSKNSPKSEYQTRQAEPKLSGTDNWAAIFTPALRVEEAAGPSALACTSRGIGKFRKAQRKDLSATGAWSFVS